MHAAPHFISTPNLTCFEFSRTTWLSMRTSVHLHAEPHLFRVSRTTWLSMRTSVHLHAKPHLFQVSRTTWLSMRTSVHLHAKPQLFQVSRTTWLSMRNKHSYFSHLVLIFTLYWCCTSSSPTKGSTTLPIYEGDKCIFYWEYIVTTKELFALDVYMQN